MTSNCITLAHVNFLFLSYKDHLRDKVSSENGSHNSPTARCASATEAINKDNGIFNGTSTGTNDSLVVDIFTKKIRNLYQILRAVQSLMFYVNFDLDFVRLFVTNLIIF